MSPCAPVTYWFNPAEFGGWLETECPGAGDSGAAREEWAETIPWASEELPTPNMEPLA